MKNRRSSLAAKKALAAAETGIRSLRKVLPEVNRAIGILEERRGDIIVTALGKPAFIGQKCAATLTSLGHRASFLHPVEAIHGDIGAMSKGDVLVALSFSGETKEVVKITEYAKKTFGIPVIAITKSRRSSLGSLADAVIEVRIKEEGSPNGIAPMASTTAMLAVVDMLAASLVDENFKDDEFARLHPGGTLGLKLRKARELLKRGRALPIVRDSAPLLDVVREVTRKKLGVTAVVGKGSSLVGIITDGDIRRSILKGLARGVTAADIMNRHPKYIRETDSLAEALAKMEQFKITHLLAVDGRGRPVGIIHIHDIVEGTLVAN